MESEGQVGPRVVSDGTENMVRTDRTAALVTHSVHGDWYESASRGKVYVASTQAAGVAPGTALGTAPPLCIWNPPDSQVIAAVLTASIGYVSGTLGAGNVVWAYCTQAADPTGGTALAPKGTNLSNSSGGVKAFQSSTTGTLLILEGTGWTLGAALATTATFPAQNALVVNGKICVPPGKLLALQGIAAAGTTPLVIYSITYEEVDTA